MADLIEWPTLLILFPFTMNSPFFFPVEPTCSTIDNMKVEPVSTSTLFFPSHDACAANESPGGAPPGTSTAI